MVHNLGYVVHRPLEPKQPAQQQQQEQQLEQEQEQPPQHQQEQQQLTAVQRLLSGSRPEGPLMPGVADVVGVLRNKGYQGLNILLESASFRDYRTQIWNRDWDRKWDRASPV
jgi:hypothetical protein